MNETIGTIGRLLAIGNVAEVFECGARVVKLYKSIAAKPAAFREAAMHAAVETIGLPVPKVWSVQKIGMGSRDRPGEATIFAEQMMSCESVTYSTELRICQTATACATATFAR